MEKQKRERSINFSQGETNILISLIEANIHIIENKKSDATTWQGKDKVWKDIEKAFNSASGSVFRNHKNLKLKYEALKRDIRKKSAMVRAERYKTGGGTRTAPQLTPAEKKVKEILVSIEGNESEFDSDLVLPSTSSSNSAEEHSDEQATNQSMITEGEFVDVHQAENEWIEWNLTAPKIKEHPVLSKPKKNRTFDKLTQEKLEIAKIQKKLITEELEQKLINRKILEKELEHKYTIHELEKQHLLLKIQLLKKELAKK